MVIVKVKDRYHIKKKDGKPGKNSWATKKSALKAQASLAKLNKKYKKKNTKKTKKKSGSKKTTKKKTTKKKNTTKKPKKVNKTTKKRSLVGYARLGIYALTIGSAAIRAVAESGFTADAARKIAHRYSATGPDGKFMAEQLRNTYGPPAVWAAIDTIASKAGVYKRIGGL